MRMFIVENTRYEVLFTSNRGILSYQLRVSCSENEGPFNSEVFIEYVVQGLAFWSEADQKSLYRHCHRNAYSSSVGGSSGGDFVGLDMRRMKKLLPHRSTRYCHIIFLHGF